MMKEHVTIKMTRQTAVRYLAWEFGLSKVRELLATGIEVTPHFYRFPIVDNLARTAYSPKLGKRAAERWTNRIRVANAYQAGRLGKPLNCGDVYVTTIYAKNA